MSGQDYTWPTSTGKELTSNFGEFRDSHFHMGIDIRTQSTIDHPLYAIQDGYIYRIATNFSGYGKVLYLKTIDGKIAVYGHLNRFNENLEDLVYDLQNENNSYFINKYFTPTDYPINRGNIIGYSGNTGGSTGPHLHFELRNDMDQPVNPLTSGFPLSDNIPPQFLDVSIIPLAPGTHINSSPLPQSYYPVVTSTNTYILKDTISISGKLGIATRVIDKIQNSSFLYQIEKLELLVDSFSTFSVRYNLLDFNESKDIVTVYGQPVNHPKRVDFQKLYRLSDYPRLSIFKNDRSGIINLTKGIHKIEIVAWDAYQNNSILTFYIKSHNKPKTEKSNNLLNLTDYSVYNNTDKVFKPEILQLEKGAIFHLQVDKNDFDKIVAFIEKSDKLLTFPLIKIGVDSYASNLINLSNFKDANACGFLKYSDTVQKYQFDFKPAVIIPNTYKKVKSVDGLCFIETNNAFHDTTLLWITKQIPQTSNKLMNRKSDIYELHPHGIPFKNAVDIALIINNSVDLDHCSIYSFDNKKLKWDFVKSRADTIQNIISASLNKAAVFTVLEDTQPPNILFANPKNQQRYSADSLKTLLIVIHDDLSGIDTSEETLKVFLDGKRIWVAYQPVDKEISYNLRDAITIGEHNLLINIQDRSGNSTSKTIKFFIE